MGNMNTINIANDNPTTNCAHTLARAAFPSD
jgi:hypothetical protein